MQALLSLVGDNGCIEIDLCAVYIQRNAKTGSEGRVNTGRPIGEACGFGMTGVQQRLPTPMVR
jgi:hypothetical protein